MMHVWLVLLASAAPVLAAPDVPARAPAPPMSIASLDTLYESDEPPRTPYDATAEEHAFTPESKSLVAVAFRGLAATAFVVLLIYLCMKVALPKLLNRIQPTPSGPSSHLRLVERMQLDAANQVYLVEVHNGPRLLLATGVSGGVQMLHSLAPAEDAFRGRMLQTPNPMPNADKDDAHAPI